MGELNEVVEILEGPVKEETVDVMRVSVKAMKDGVQGWVTLAGNQGSKFLEEGGNTFKVVKETILTESFGLETSASKESTRKLRDTTRKLKEGEFVEVREWPRKEPTSGLMRRSAEHCLTAARDGRPLWEMLAPFSWRSYDHCSVVVFLIFAVHVCAERWSSD